MQAKYSKGTDSAHKIKLEPRLIYAVWRQGVAPAAGEVPFEVGTSFVGSGAPVKVKGKSEGGAKLGTVDGKMRNNVFVGKLSIPDDIEIDDEVYFEVKLSSNSLSGESNRIPAVPGIVVSNMKWSPTEAHRGEVVTLSADVENCRPDSRATVSIFEYDRDNIHDSVVSLPATVTDGKLEVRWEYQYHEDVDTVPTEAELQKYGKHYNPPEYFFVVEIDGQKFGREQESGLLTFQDWIEIKGENLYGEPLRNRDYIVRLPDGTEKKGKLDGSGYARVEGIPPGMCEVEIPPEEK